MSETSDPRLEQLAETVAFAHDPTTAWPAATTGTADAAALRSLERTAALAATALAARPELPKQLQDRLAAAGLNFCAEQRRKAGPATGPTGRPTAFSASGSAANLRPVAAAAIERPATGTSVRTFLFGLAAGAALWFGWGALRTAPPAAPTLTEQRASLLAAPATVRLPWKAGPSPRSGAVTGEVLWSQDQQQGILTFRGLPALDAEHAYQLWIVDGNRTGAPVDGGVFALADGTAETLVAVQAKLPIGKPAAFVVTVEERAGVVVSKQEHVVAIAGL